MGYRYIGSKARIAKEILDYLGHPEIEDGYFIDAFSGTGIVASTAADYGWKVKINDMMKSSIVVSEAHLISYEDISFSKLGGYAKALEIMNSQNKQGFIWREYSPASLNQKGIERKYFSEENAQIIDGAIEVVYTWKNSGTISESEFSLLMSSLISAVNNVANIAGTYGCFLSKWTEQSKNRIKLECLPLREAKVDYQVFNQDVFELTSNLEDIVYYDPPYTKRQYASYYHILETIVQGDEPVVEGVSGLRPWKNKASVFCYKSKALKALVDLVVNTCAKRVLISYSNDGHIKLDDLEKNLKLFGQVKVVEIGSIGKYRPNVIASDNGSSVKEYLIDFVKERANKL